MSLPGCGCGNWWNNAPLGPCGPFDDPTVADEGQCSPAKVKITCEAPTLPVAQCNDSLYQVVYQPENVDNPFGIIASLFNEACAAITDQNGGTITLFLTQMG